MPLLAKGTNSTNCPLIPAKAGIQFFNKVWVPAFAGTSGIENATQN
jgi:hypothetical protein